MNQLCIEKDVSEFGCNLISWGLYFGYFLFGITLIAALVLPFINALKNPKAIVKAGIGVAALVGVFILAFAISTDEVTSIGAALGVSSTSSKMIGAGLIVFYISLIGAAVGLLYSEVSKAFK